MSEGSKRVIYWAIAANVAIAVAKFVAAAITGSSAMLSEAIHSLVDTSDGVVMLAGSHLAGRPADADHPYGHGRELYFWSFVVAVLVFSLGGGVSAYDGVHRLMHPEPLRSALWSYIVLGVSFVFEGTSLVVSVRHFNTRRKAGASFALAVHRSKDPSDFIIVFEDGAALIGLTIAAIGVSLQLWTGRAIFDGMASILIGLLLAGVALVVAWETRSLLVGEGLSKAMKEEVRDILRNDADVATVGDPLGTYLGPDTVVLNVSVKFRRDLTMDALDRAVARIEHAIRGRFPVIKYVFFAGGALRRD